MSRDRQLKTAKDVLERTERRHAQALAASERRVRESEAKLAELEGYRADYLRDFAGRAATGITAGSARNFQGFITRVEEALREQAQVVARVRAERAEELRKWRLAAQRSSAVGRVIDNHQLQERRRAERREQASADEHAQSRWAAKGTRRDH